MTDREQEIRARHARDAAFIGSYDQDHYPSLRITPAEAHDDRGWLLDALDEAYAERNAWQTYAFIARQEAETVVKEWKAVAKAAEARLVVVCPHCHLPADLPAMCTPAVNTGIEARIKADADLVEAGRQLGRECIERLDARVTEVEFERDAQRALALQMGQERDEARATVARLENEMACLVAPEELRQWQQRAEAAESERDCAHARATAFFEDGLEVRGRLRAAVEALKQACERYGTWYHDGKLDIRSAIKLVEGAAAPTCDGNHALPRCSDPECWHD